MRKKTLRMISSILSVLFLVSLFQAELSPVMAAKTATSKVAATSLNVDGKVYNITPGTNITMGTPKANYNVRFINGKPYAIEVNQMVELILNDTVVPVGGSGSTAQTATSGSTAAQSATSGSSAVQSATTSAGNSNQMTWNQFQKANAGKGMSPSEMSSAYQQYKQTGNVNAGSAAASTGSTNTSAVQTSQTTPAPTTSVAEGAVSTAQTSNTAAQSSTSAVQSSGNTAQASVADASAGTTSSKSSSWNPAKHPRDPQTGRFISHEEAVARGLMDPADANISSNGSSSQTAQAGSDSSATGQTTADASQATTDTATSGTVSEGASQVAQAGDASSASGAKESKPTIGDKFKSGYETGKNLTNQGFQNVKDSLKSGFSAKNLLVTAGITVGVDLASQIVKGEDISLKKAVKQVCCAEFVGSVTGSVLGSAAGSFFVPFLSAIPVVGGVLSALAPSFGSIVGSAVGAYTAGDLKNGRFSIKEAFKRLDWVGVTGQAIGSTAGAALGSFLGPIGTVVGGMIGGYLGNWAAHKIAGLFGKGEANLPAISTPTGTSTSGGSVVGGVVDLGGNSGSVTVSEVTVSDDEDEEIASTEGMSGNQVEEAINQAYEEYTELYTEYSKLIQSGKAEEAMEVAVKMNAAKLRYDELRKKG